MTPCDRTGCGWASGKFILAALYLEMFLTQNHQAWTDLLGFHGGTQNLHVCLSFLIHVTFPTSGLAWVGLCLRMFI